MELLEKACLTQGWPKPGWPSWEQVKIFRLRHSSKQNLNRTVQEQLNQGVRARGMAVPPQGLKDPQILLLRAEAKSTNIAVDNVAKEIVGHIIDVEAAKSNSDLPKSMVYD